MQDHTEQKPKTVKIPGPDHPITVTRNAHRVVVLAAGWIVADTREALTLREANYPPVQYIPMKDVDTALLERTAYSTYCPYKGECTYYSIPIGREHRSMPCGHMKSHTRRLPRLKTMWRFTRTAPTYARNSLPINFPRVMRLDNNVMTAGY